MYYTTVQTRTESRKEKNFNMNMAHVHTYNMYVWLCMWYLLSRIDDKKIEFLFKHGGKCPEWNFNEYHIISHTVFI